MHSPQQMETFNARIKRIQNPRFTHYVDPDNGMKIPRRVSRGEIGHKAAPPLALVTMAVILGAICLMVARYLRMEVINVEPYFPGGLIAEMSLATMAAVTIGGLVKMRSLRTFAAQVAGALVCAVTMHNAVWLAPDQFAAVFSQSYVDQILALTEPMSVFVNGTSYTLTI